MLWRGIIYFFFFWEKIVNTNRVDCLICLMGTILVVISDLWVKKQLCERVVFGHQSPSIEKIKLIRYEQKGKVFSKHSKL